MADEIILRPVGDADIPFLLDVYCASRRDEVASFGWDRAQQEAFLAMQFSIRQRSYPMQYPGAEDSVIVCKGESAGRMIVGRSTSELTLIDIAVLPEFRGNGVATRLIGELQAEAGDAGVPLALTVDRANPRAFGALSKAWICCHRREPIELRNAMGSGEMTQNISLRPVTDGDREFLIGVYGSSRTAELAMMPWDDDQKRQFVEFQYSAQTTYYLDKYPRATHDIILLDSNPCGRLYVDRRDAEIAILDVIVMPEFRNKGVATYLINTLKAEAKPGGRSIGVYVETLNPSQKLFRDLGFEVDSETEMNLHFCWSPGTDQS